MMGRHLFRDEWPVERTLDWERAWYGDDGYGSEDLGAEAGGIDVHAHREPVSNVILSSDVPLSEIEAYDEDNLRTPLGEHFPMELRTRFRGNRGSAAP